MWWMKLWPLTPLIIVAILVGCLIAVIILICIIICMCRRRRKRSSKSKKSFPKCEVHNEKLLRFLFLRAGLIVNFIFHFFGHSAGMEKSLVDNKPNDPNAEPCENYENLPFHGLQNPPTKVRQSLFQIPPRRVFVLCKLSALIAVVTFLAIVAGFDVRPLLMFLSLLLSHRCTSVDRPFTYNKHLFDPLQFDPLGASFTREAAPPGKPRLISPDLTLIRLP